MSSPQYIALKNYFTKSVIVPSASGVKLQTFEGGKKGPVDFMGKYKIRITKNGANVLDGSKIIASIGPLIDLYVVPDYRGQDIPKNLIAAWYLDNLDFEPMYSPSRTQFGATAYAAAWPLVEAAVIKKWPEKNPRND